MLTSDPAGEYGYDARPSFPGNRMPGDHCRKGCSSGLRDEATTADRNIYGYVNGNPLRTEPLGTYSYDEFLNGRSGAVTMSLAAFVPGMLVAFPLGASR